MEGAPSSFKVTHPTTAKLQGEASGAAENPQTKMFTESRSGPVQELGAIGLPMGSKWGCCGASSSPPGSLVSVLLVLASGASAPP